MKEVIKPCFVTGVKGANVGLGEGEAVDDSMGRSHPDSHAAGVVCMADWAPAFHWLQMRLWTQARQMGIQASRSMVTHMPMAGEESELDFGSVEIERLRNLVEIVHSRDPRAVPCNESEETMNDFGYFSSSTKETRPFRPPVSALNVGGLNTSLPVVCSSAGSCQDQCGRGSRSSCWCDELCEDTGDCCCDRDTLCKLTQADWVSRHQPSTMASIDTTTAPSPTTSTEAATEPGEAAVLNTTDTTSPTHCISAGSCAGRGGGGSGGDCWVDDICDNTGDCCCDRDRQDCLCDRYQFCSHSPLGWVSNNANVRPTPTLPSLGAGSLPCLAGSSAGRCGGQAGAGCWCDEVCLEAGDCCCDRGQGQRGWVDRNITSTEAPSHTRPQTWPSVSSSTLSVSTATVVTSISSTEPSEDSNDEVANDVDKTLIPTTTLPQLCISSGSCVDRCWGGFDSTCWCDTRCSQAQDCCCHKEEVCTRTQAGWVNAVNNISETSTQTPTSTQTLSISTESSSQSTVATQSSNQSSQLTVSTPSSSQTSLSTVSTQSSSQSTVSAKSSSQSTSSTKSSSHSYQSTVSTQSLSQSSTFSTDATPSLGAQSAGSTSLTSEISSTSSISRSSFQDPESTTTEEIPVQTKPVFKEPNANTNEGSAAKCRSPGTCSGSCKAGDESDCWCDESCPGSPDCCCDYEDMCVDGVGPEHSQAPTNSTLSPAPASSDNSTATPTAVTPPPVPTAASKTVPPAVSAARCTTIGGPAPNHGCVFPFTHRNKTFTTCTSSHTRTRPWCSTKVDSRQRFIGGDWGFCGASCTRVTVGNYTLSTKLTVYLAFFALMEESIQLKHEVDQVRIQVCLCTLSDMH